jgi:hypothetical protein
MNTGDKQDSWFVLIVQGTPPGAENLCSPDLYPSSLFTWGLYDGSNRFLCSGQSFLTQGEAFTAASEFLESFPNQDIGINSPEQN